MDDEMQDRRLPASGRRLSQSELTARRAAARRRRRQRRRRGAGLTVSAIVAITVAILATSGTDSGASRQRTATATATTAPAGQRVRVHTSPAASPPRAVTQAAARSPQAVHTAGVASARAVDRVLGYTSYIQLSGHRRRDVALTFDDGPSPYTSAVLRVLRRMHAHATFFVVGRSISVEKKLVAAEVRDGNEVGDHTVSHPPLAQLSAAAQAEQIAGAAAAIRNAGAPSPRLMRPPYGSFNTTTLQILRAQRMLMVLWSVDTKDYSRPGVSRIIYTAVSGAQAGAIILMHDGGGERSQTVAALPRIIARLRQRGFRLVTLSRLMADDPPPRHQPPPHSLSGGV